MQTVLAIDFDSSAALTYAENFPLTQVVCASVGDVVNELPRADVIVGGPPCQPHSLAGKRGASSDERDGGDEFVAAIHSSRPRHFLMENVPGLISSESGKYWQRLYAMLESAGSGYVIQYRILDACSFGVPQFRERLFVWGIRRDVHAGGVRHSWPMPTHSWPWPQPCMFGAELLPAVTVGWALNIPHRQVDGVWFEGNGRSASLSLQPHGGFEGGEFEIGSPSPTPRNCLPGCGDMELKVMGAGRNDIDRGDGHFARDERDITAEPSTTLAGTHLGIHKGAQNPRIHEYRWSDGTNDGGGHTHAKRNGLVRRLTPLECARLQSMPDDFRWPSGISKTAQYKIVGNGQASKIMWELRQAICLADPLVRTCIDLFCGGGVGAAGWHGRFWEFKPE